MATKKQLAAFERRRPTQARARDTVDAIFEAAARILERDGARALNTNAIAERAGISIGSLYEYFPNKQALLVAMARRVLEEDRTAIVEVISKALADPDAQLDRLAIRKLVELHATRPEVRRAVMAAHLSEGLGAEHARPVQEVAELIAARSGRLGASSPTPIPPAALFVATRAVIGVVRAAFEERSSLLGTTELEDELVRLVEGYLPQLKPAV